MLDVFHCCIKWVFAIVICHALVACLVQHLKVILGLKHFLPGVVVRLFEGFEGGAIVLLVCFLGSLV